MYVYLRSLFTLQMAQVRIAVESKRLAWKFYYLYAEDRERWKSDASDDIGMCKVEVMRFHSRNEESPVHDYGTKFDKTLQRCRSFHRKIPLCTARGHIY